MATNRDVHATLAVACLALASCGQPTDKSSAGAQTTGGEKPYVLPRPQPTFNRTYTGETTFHEGVIATESLTGIYTVASDCTGTGTST